MNSTPTHGQFTAIFCLIFGIGCFVVAVMTSAIIAVGWIINWLIPSIRFDSACIIAGIACAFAGFVLRGAAKFIYARAMPIFPPAFQDDDDDDDDYIFDEEMADRIAELTVSKLSRPVVQKKYTAKKASQQ